MRVYAFASQLCHTACQHPSYSVMSCLQLWVLSWKASRLLAILLYDIASGRIHMFYPIWSHMGLGTMLNLNQSPVCKFLKCLKSSAFKSTYAQSMTKHRRISNLVVPIAYWQIWPPTKLSSTFALGIVRLQTNVAYFSRTNLAIAFLNRILSCQSTTLSLQVSL